MEDLLQIGVITSTHGIKGEVKVFPTTDTNDRFQKLKECYIEFQNQMIPVNVQGVKFFKNMVILKFQEIEDINDVEQYRKCKLFVDKAHAVALDTDEYFMADLIGIQALTEEGRELGKLSEIISTGANDVYVVTGQDGKEWLLPAIKDCIRKVDIKNRCMTVRLMNGMEE